MGRHKKEKEGTESPPIVDTERKLKFVSSGCTMLNLALTNSVDGGYPIGKIINLVGDKQIGKSLLAIELINYIHYVLIKNYDVRMVYDETESALDVEQAVSIGFPIDQVVMKQSATVEDLYKNLKEEIEISDKYDLSVYVLDSLDAISSEDELEQDFNKKSFDMTKQKQLSKLFRQLTQKVDKKNIILIIISQIRDKIGVTFGETKTRAGGKALDFYASQIIWLYNKGQSKNGNIVTGIEVKSKVKKNRAWKPFREVEFTILFGYGIDNLGSMVDFLIDNKYFIKTGNGRLQYGEQVYSREDLIQFISNNNKEQEIREAVKQVWDTIEKESTVIRKPKYEGMRNVDL